MIYIKTTNERHCCIYFKKLFFKIYIIYFRDGGLGIDTQTSITYMN